jgi:hypothetical protein
MPQAQKVRQVDFLHADGWREVQVVWRLADGSYRARLSLLNRRGERRCGYDWHHGKDAHRHYGSTEALYDFTTVETLLKDFERDVKRIRWEEEP